MEAGGGRGGAELCRALDSAPGALYCKPSYFRVYYKHLNGPILIHTRCQANTFISRLVF